MTGPVASHVSPAVFGRQGAENGAEPLHHAFVPADHETVAQLKAPYAAARSRIHVGDAFLLELRGSANVVMKVRVAAVNDRIARGQEITEGIDGLLGGRAGRHHDPYCSRRPKFGDQLIKRSCADASYGLRLGDDVGSSVVDNDAMFVPLQSCHHVHAHLSQPDEAEFHGDSFPYKGTNRLRYATHAIINRRIWSSLTPCGLSSSLWPAIAMLIDS